MSLDFKKIKPAHLLSTFGKQESEEAIALALALTGEDTTVVFTKRQLGPRGSLYIHDFVHGGWITQCDEGAYTINKKLVDFINSKEKQILAYMARGDTYTEVLGLKNLKLEIPRKATKKELKEYCDWLAHTKRLGLEEY